MICTDVAGDCRVATTAAAKALIVIPTFLECICFVCVCGFNKEDLHIRVLLKGRRLLYNNSSNLTRFYTLPNTVQHLREKKIPSGLNENELLLNLFHERIMVEEP